MPNIKTLSIIAILAGTFLVPASGQQKLLNVSFDISRELYSAYNPLFEDYYKQKTGKEVKIEQSHGGSGRQARAVVDGLEADVVTLNEDTNIDILYERGRLVPKDWKKLFPNNSAPYYSTMIFLVRKGNPKKIRDWDDLVKPGVGVVKVNPKTGGNGKYAFLAAYEYALQKYGEDGAKDFIKKLYQNVPILETGGRGATTSFVQRGIGDVLVTFEAEVLLIKGEIGGDKFDVVVPSSSIVANMPVAVVDKVAAKHGTTELAKEYLTYLWSEPAQNVIAQKGFRPRNAEVLAKNASRFKNVRLFEIDSVFGSWGQAQKKFFDEGGVFDQLYKK